MAHFRFYGVAVSAVACGLTIFSGDAFAPDLKTIHAVIPLFITKQQVNLNDSKELFKEQLKQQLHEELQQVVYPLFQRQQASPRLDLMIQGQNIPIRLHLRLFKFRQEVILFYRVENLSDPLLEVELPDNVHQLIRPIIQELSDALPELGIARVQPYSSRSS